MAPTTSTLRAAALPALWGALGFAHASGAPLPVVCLATVLAACLGIAAGLWAAEHTGWSSLLAAVMLATSPALQKLWMLPRDLPASESLGFLKTMLVLGGLLMLSRLEAAQEPDAGDAGD